MERLPSGRDPNAIYGYHGLIGRLHITWFVKRWNIPPRTRARNVLSARRRARPRLGVNGEIRNLRLLSSCILYMHIRPGISRSYVKINVHHARNTHAHFAFNCARAEISLWRSLSETVYPFDLWRNYFWNLTVRMSICLNYNDIIWLRFYISVLRFRD